MVVTGEQGAYSTGYIDHDTTFHQPYLISSLQEAVPAQGRLAAAEDTIRITNTTIALE